MNSALTGLAVSFMDALRPIPNWNVENAVHRFPRQQRLDNPFAYLERHNRESSRNLEGPYDYDRDRVELQSYTQAPSEHGFDNPSSMRFDLAATDICWKKVVGIECGEPSDPESETGLCTTHYTETRSQWAGKR